jgi:hypothetical protein
MNRRRFITTSFVGAVTARELLAQIAATPVPVRISPAGKLLHECSLPGESRADGAFPAHPNGLRLSRDRFLLLYATRGWRGVDEDRSIVYQVRAGGFDGLVLKEGLLARSVDDWDPLGDGGRYFKAHGHPGGFGVPKGAWVGGRPAPHANLFVLKWYRYGRRFSAPDRLERPLAESSGRLHQQTISTQWVHARLNEGGNDIEILEPARALRAPGFASGDRAAELVNQTYVQPQPFNDAATEWIDLFMRGWPEKSPPGAAGPVAAKFR